MGGAAGGRAPSCEDQATARLRRSDWLAMSLWRDNRRHGDPNEVSKPPWKPLSLGPVALAAERLADGSTVLRSRHELLPYPRCLGEMLHRWAAAAPERTFLAERPAR